MAKSRRFMQCDVFSTTPMGGNGLAVVLDGAELGEDAMQRFARWTNLAETTFIFPPSDPAADYDIRIFTVSRELPFAGHPTLGTAACWLEAGNTPKQAGVIRQNCGVGLVEIDLTGDTPAFVAPPTSITSMAAKSLAAITAGLNLDPTRIMRHAVLDNGPIWHAIEMQGADDLLTLDAGAITPVTGLAVGLIAPHSKGDADFEVRMFSMWAGLTEDPITGSLNAALAHWMQTQGRVQRRHIIAQGTCIRRHGRVHVIPSADDPDRGPIRIGGHTNILIKGHVTL
ncbi:PhzF family phenazine biosynthesis protein [Octadecabacter antarcticus]|uniref:PhzF family phenazine biosynthesis protein n=1 Tax=Octadecabacter antarcticus TaxID=1217908 RepID=UPI001FDFA69F|nr:PhzF family phenazine biosynthesis protein [Octadecabacter antarcticus]